MMCGVRADAQRNRDRILGAARDAVAEAGVDATMEDIARRAGVAVGTLYRHFPAKDDLLVAVMDDSMEQIAALTEKALADVDGGAPAGPALGGLFRAVAVRFADDLALKAATGRLGADGDLAADVGAEDRRRVLLRGGVVDVAAAEPGSTVLRAVTAITAVLDRARAAGAVRADLTLDDLMVLLAAMPGREVAAEMRERLVDIVIAGLTAAPTATGEAT
jgi:AcrR family transcriptional regulator